MAKRLIYPTLDVKQKVISFSDNIVATFFILAALAAEDDGNRANTGSKEIWGAFHQIQPVIYYHS